MIKLSKFIASLIFISIIVLLTLFAEKFADVMPTAEQKNAHVSGEAENQTQMREFIARCRHVVDGDSLYLDGTQEQIRLWGVDAPERDEAGYKAARQALIDYALHKQLRCVEQDIDKYGRIVARCFLFDDSGDYREKSSQEINYQLLKKGVSDEYCRFTHGFYGLCENR